MSKKIYDRSFLGFRKNHPVSQKTRKFRAKYINLRKYGNLEMMPPLIHTKFLNAEKVLHIFITHALLVRSMVVKYTHTQTHTHTFENR